MSFIETTNGFINLDSVVRISRGRKKAEGRAVAGVYYLLFDKNNTLLGEALHTQSLDIEKLTAPIIPAAADEFAWVVSCGCDESQRPTAEHQQVWKKRIVAWRLLPGMCAQAVFLEGEDEQQDGVLVNELDGRVRHQFVQCYENIEEAKADLLLEAQKAWDRRQTTFGFPETIDGRPARWLTD